MPKETDWEFIVETIKNEKCILLLGPEMCFTDKKQHFEKALIEHLDVDNNEKILRYYEDESLFLFKDGGSKTMCYYEIKKFYQQGFDCDIYDKISKIPFHLIVSITPDLLLLNMFRKNKIPHEFHYYDKTTNPIDMPAISKETPLLYYLLGSIEKEESLVLTHDDLFDFLLAILGTRNLPNELLISFQGADNLIFLGFKFDKWYVQLLLRLLNLHQDQYKFVRYASNIKIDHATQALCIDQFNIKFVEDKCAEFVNHLNREFQDQGLLREPDESGKSVAEEVEKLIKKNDFVGSLNALQEYSKEKDDKSMIEVVINLRGRHSSLRHKRDLNIIDERDAEIEENKIRIAIIDINKELKASEKL